MKTYTHITHWQDDGEIHATIMRLDKIVGSFDIIGDFEDEQDIIQSLNEEASRLEYSKVSFQQATMSDMGKQSAARMTQDERTKRASDAAKKRWK